MDMGGKFLRSLSYIRVTFLFLLWLNMGSADIRTLRTSDPAVDQRKTCCACVYQNDSASSFLGPCEKRSWSNCAEQYGACAWSWLTYSCYPKFKEECEGEKSPFKKWIQSQGLYCKAVGIFPNSTFIDSPVDESSRAPNIATWSEEEECTNLHVWYTGHGQSYPMNKAQDIIQSCPEGTSSITCTGCNGMVNDPKTDKALIKKLCEQLMNSGQSGSISTTGNQTCVSTHNALSPKTITVSYISGAAECSSEISYGACSHQLIKCEKALDKQWYNCTDSSGVVIKRICQNLGWGWYYR